MDADGGNVRQLTDNPGSDINPAWSPDGTRIAFSRYRAWDKDIYVMDADGGNVQRLTEPRRGTHGYIGRLSTRPWSATRPSGRNSRTPRKKLS